MNVDTGQFEALSRHVVDNADQTIATLRSLSAVMYPQRPRAGRPVLRLIHGGPALASAGATAPTVAGGLSVVAVETANDLGASTGRIRPALRRILAAVMVMATAFVAAGNRVTELAPAVAGRREVVSEGRHVLTPGRSPRRRPGRIRTRGRHVRPRWRILAGRWFWLARDEGRHGPLSAAA